MQTEQDVFFLEGTWRGTGKVKDSLGYDEEIQIIKTKPNVYFYQQKTKNAEKGPLHSEVGYMRVFRDGHATEGKLELIASHPFGVGEVSEGTFTSNSATLKTASMVRTGSAIEPYVTKLTRVFKLKDADTLTYTVDMGTTKNTEECPHLEGELKRVSQ